MESNDWRFGWAADDPRWDDAHAGGNGRLEPTPAPAFGRSSDDSAADQTPWTVDGNSRPADAPADDAWSAVQAQWPAADTQWPAAETSWSSRDTAWPAGAADAEPTSDASRSSVPHPSAWPLPPRTGEPVADPYGSRLPDVFDAPLAIGATASDFGENTGPVIGTATVPGALPLSAASLDSPPTRSDATWSDLSQSDRAPWSVDGRPDGLPAPLLPGLGAPGGVRPGFGLLVHRDNPTDVAGPAPAGQARPTRLERQVRLRRRRGTEDEFYQATRAELLSDDARYKVLFALTGGWYLPVAVVYLVWAILTGSGSALAGLGWLIGGAVLALAIAGLLRWAQVSWRALTLSLAAAVIGGAVATLAHTLSS